MSPPRPSGRSPILRLEGDPGLLTNRRLALEIGVGLAHLGGRRLSMPWHERIGPSPGNRPASADAPDVRPTVFDLWEVPVEVVTDEEWEDHSGPAQEVDWGPFTQCVYLGDDAAIPHPGITDFANGRTRFVRLPDVDAAVAVSGRPMAFPSYFFHATGPTRRGLLEAIDAVRLRPDYLQLAERISSELPRANVAHVRRTDLVKGIRAYAGVSPLVIADNLASILPTDELLLIATEADPASRLFDPIRERFTQVEFVSNLILGDHASAFAALEFHEDNALGVITQEIAARAERFVGTIGSTFTGMIQRLRCRRDPLAPFAFTADYTPAGPVFTDGVYQERRPGRYSWNRVGLAVSPDVCAWLREWPEAVSSPDDRVDTAPDRRAERGLPIHAVVCTDTNPYGNWQCELQEHTWARVRQPGELVRLVGCPDGERPPEMRHARVVTTAARNTHPDAPEDYAGFNRLWSLQEWLHRERVTGSVLILDSDFVFRGPIHFVATPGVVIAQEWYGPGIVESLRHRLAPVTTIDPQRIEPVTWPLVIDAGDLRRILPRWLELTAALRRTSGNWESDMFALVGALAEDGIRISYETLGAWMDWPEEFVAGAPIIHYCQPVKDRRGAPMWFKQAYRPWDRIGCDPNDAALDYCRDFLHLLDEFVRTRTTTAATSSTETVAAGDGGAEPRIAILVIGCLLPVFDRCIATIRSTWGSRAVDGVDVFYAYGSQPTESAVETIPLAGLVGRPVPHVAEGAVWASGDILVCGAADLWEDQRNCVLRKRLAAFAYLANERSYDVIYTVCASSYVDVDRLKRYVSALPTRAGVYHGGVIIHEETGAPFVSGASLLLSRDLAAELANRAPEIIAGYPESMPDDVVLGHVIATRHGNRPVEEISARIAAGLTATDDQTFVVPYGYGSVDYVMTPEADQIPHESSYHFHFHSRRSWEMENFHRRYFAT